MNMKVYVFFLISMMMKQKMISFHKDEHENKNLVGPSFCSTFYHMLKIFSRIPSRDIF